MVKEHKILFGALKAGVAFEWNNSVWIKTEAGQAVNLATGSVEALMGTQKVKETDFILVREQMLPVMKGVRSTEMKDPLEKCSTCQHCYKRKNDDELIYCRKRNGKCDYKEYRPNTVGSKLSNEKNKEI